MLGRMATEEEALRTHLGLADTAALDLAETITPRTFAAVPSPPLPSTLPSLPHLSLSIPGAPVRADGRVPDLDVKGVLGEGGMGRVLLARQRSLQRDVAVKVLKDETTDPESLTNLLAEAVVTGSLEHPSIVPVHALGRDDGGRPVLVMKRIEGVSWRDLARDPQHPSWASLDEAGEDRLGVHVQILMAVCNAVHFAHRRGIVHRDLKPSNVMIGPYGEVYVVDWGIAARIPTDASAPVEPSPVALVGTPAFMAPEMVWGEVHRVDARTDVYLLGATLHGVITGHVRHQGSTLFEMLFAARDSAPYAYGRDVPAELAAICNKATAEVPDDRYPSAMALRRALADFLRHRGSIALSDVAQAQLAEIRAALAAPATADPRRLHQRMTECRFGFTQALRAWKDNPAARCGLGACLGLMIEHEIAQRDRDGAAALLAELPEPRPDLERLLAALAADLAAQRDRDARLARIERDQDPSVGARHRIFLAAVLTVLGIILSVLGTSLGPERLGTGGLIGFTLVVAVVVLTVVFLGRRRFAASHLGRVAGGASVVWALASLALRLVGVRQGLSVTQILTLEMVQTTALLGVGSVTLPRGIWWSVVIGAATALTAAIRPEVTVIAYSIGGVLVSASLVVFGYRMAK
jgi:eukaryotic-like serine/threonine-protein kinase